MIVFLVVALQLVVPWCPPPLAPDTSIVRKCSDICAEGNVGMKRKDTHEGKQACRYPVNRFARRKMGKEIG
ncbi:uncharacterized protein LY79DRAFT_569674 [Colletotrichum navitas]|uniref:Uncharacterized protein n=1 Tax=Colletotrichum navitas TaxID=681940 RepID=A0AAD8PMW0_9PEZI|nr:uncharacterized protein LY79DRAFT_569674 [Colletotrichum navitas]KAK1572853.1 hypothetical protein LY79DRAFT_569674 [Colletotrichum navitas]